MSTVHSGRSRVEIGKPDTQQPKVQPTVEQLQIAHLLHSPKKCSPQDIAQVVEVTGCSLEVAEATLENCQNDPLEAIEKLLTQADEQDEWQEAGKRRPRKPTQPAVASSTSDTKRDRSKSQQNGVDEAESHQAKPARGGDSSRGRKNQPPRFRADRGASDRQPEENGENRRRGARRNQQNGSGGTGRGRSGRRGGGERSGRGARRANNDSEKSNSQRTSEMSISMWTGEPAAPSTNDNSHNNMNTWPDSAGEPGSAPVADELDDEWSGDLHKGVEFTPSHMRGTGLSETNGNAFEHSAAIHVNVADILKSVGKGPEGDVAASPETFSEASNRLHPPEGFPSSVQSQATENFLLAESIKNAVGIGKPQVTEDRLQSPAYDMQQAAEDIKSIVGVDSQRQPSVQPNIQPPKMKFQRSKLPPPSKIPAAPVQMPRAYSAQSRDLQFGVDFGSELMRYTTTSSQTRTDADPIVAAATASSSEALSCTTLESSAASLGSGDTQSEQAELRSEQVEARPAVATPSRVQDTAETSSPRSSGAELSSSFPQQFSTSTSQSFSQSYPGSAPLNSAQLPSQQKSGFVNYSGYSESSADVLAQQQPTFQQSDFQNTSSVADSAPLYGSAASPLRHKLSASSEAGGQQAAPQAQQPFTQFQSQSAYQTSGSSAREQFSGSQLTADFSQLSTQTQDSGAATYESAADVSSGSTSQASAAVSTASSAVPSAPQYSAGSSLAPTSLTVSSSASGQPMASQPKLATTTGLPNNLPPMFPSPLMPGPGMPVMPMLGVPSEYDLQMRMLMGRDQGLANLAAPSPGDTSNKLSRGESVQSPPQQQAAASATAGLNQPISSAAGPQQQPSHPFMQYPLNAAAAALYYNMIPGMLSLYGMPTMTQASPSAASMPALQRNATYGTQAYDYDQQQQQQPGQEFKYGAANPQSKQHLSGAAASGSSDFNAAYGKAHHGYDKQGAGNNFHANTPPPFNYMQGLGSGSGQGGFASYMPMMPPPSGAQQGMMHPHMPQQDASGARMNPQSSGAGQTKPPGSKPYNYWN